MSHRETIAGFARGEVADNWPDGTGGRQEAMPWDMILELILQILPELFKGCTQSEFKIQQQIKSSPSYYLARVEDKAHPIARRYVASQFGPLGQIFYYFWINSQARQIAQRLANSMVDSAIGAPQQRFAEVALAAKGLS